MVEVPSRKKDPYEPALPRSKSNVAAASSPIRVSSFYNKPGRLCQGPGTHEIPLDLFVNNRERLIERLGPHVSGKAVVLLQGGDEVPLYDTDTPYAPFRQESFFMWTFGVVEPGCYGAIDVQTKTNYLFIPRFPESYTIWKGPLPTPQEVAKKYGVHHVNCTDEVASVLQKMGTTVLLTLRGLNSDSNLNAHEARFSGIDKFQVNSSVLYNVMADLRTIKNDYEIEVLKYVGRVTAEAHRHVMRYAKPGFMEHQCDAEFLRYCYSTGGCRHSAFTSSCASGDNTSYVYYSPAEYKLIEVGDLCHFRMGASYFGYCSKVTSTFPANGRFTPKQKLVYEAVLVARKTVFKQLRPGVQWTDMHLLSQRTLLSELKRGGLLRGDVDQMMSAGLGVIFHPHGLGTLLGLDAHDVGGFIGAKRSDQRSTNMLRTTRVLKEKMVLTLAPGCYFNEALMNEAFANPSMSRYLVREVLLMFRSVGGVRIEDCVLITKTGAVSLTNMPRSVGEVEDWLLGRDDDRYK